jgi:hypothetical protein
MKAMLIFDIVFLQVCAIIILVLEELEWDLTFWINLPLTENS